MCNDSAIWLCGWCHMKLLPSQHTFCGHHTTMHQFSHFIWSNICRVHVCSAVTCHLHFWQNDRDLLCATVVTQGWNGYWNKSQHRMLTLEKKICPVLRHGLKPMTVHHESGALTTELSPLPIEWQTTATKRRQHWQHHMYLSRARMKGQKLLHHHLWHNNTDGTKKTHDIFYRVQSIVMVY